MMGQAQQKRRAVLIVEDDAELRSLMAALLQMSDAWAWMLPLLFRLVFASTRSFWIAMSPLLPSPTS